MPPSEAEALTAAASELGLPMSARQNEQLRTYLDELQRWNAAYNLTAVRDRAQMRVQHLFDCLAVVGPLAAWWQRRPGAALAPALRVLDVGSGGGLPGVVLAVMAPDWQVTCIDAVAKKAAFVTQAAAALQLPNLRGVHGRVEGHQGPTGGYPVITSRAFSSLADFTRLTSPLLASGGAWMAMKGQTPSDEIAALPADVEVFHVEPLSVPQLQAQRCLVWMQKTG